MPIWERFLPDDKGVAQAMKRLVSGGWVKSFAPAVVRGGVVCALTALPVLGAPPPQTHFTPANGAYPFADPLPLSGAAYDEWMLGKSFFSIPWVEAPSATTARDGLGPHFNANTCNSCHVDNGSAPTLNASREPLRALVFKLTQPARHGERWQVDNVETPLHDSVADPVYGVQIAINGNGKVRPEARTRLRVEPVPFTYPDGRKRVLTAFHPYLDRLSYGGLDPGTTISLHQPPALAGLGLVARVADAAIIAWADPHDGDHDGISGRPNWLGRPGAAKRILGRYNWKASAATLVAQTANAAAYDLGLSNPFHPQELCQPAQTDCLAAPRGRETGHGSLDLPGFRLNAIAAYVAGHKAPQPVSLDNQAQAGKRLFHKIGCADCHRETLTTRDGIVFHPYSDYLLHDMGEKLGDGRPEFLAGEREFRSAPLWGLGARLRAGERFLHDARAADPEEAILWHGGEARRAREAFIHLGHAARAALLHFLEHL